MTGQTLVRRLLAERVAKGLDFVSGGTGQVVGFFADRGRGLRRHFPDRFGSPLGLVEGRRSRFFDFAESLGAHFFGRAQGLGSCFFGLVQGLAACLLGFFEVVAFLALFLG